MWRRTARPDSRFGLAPSGKVGIGIVAFPGDIDGVEVVEGGSRMGPPGGIDPYGVRVAGESRVREENEEKCKPRES